MTSMSQLPDDILAEIFSLLPVPNLCRYLTLCKGWHSLIRKPDFGVLRMKSENAKFYQDFGWSFMDLSGDQRSKVWRTVTRCEMDVGAPGDALTNYWFTSGALAMDAGLVCEFLKSDRLKVAKVFVYNPIGKTQHVLPFQYLMCKTSYRIQLQMVVDNIAHTYKIYLMNNTDDDGTNVAIPILRAYDSSRASSGWRTCSRPPIMSPICSVMFEGMLYVMFYCTARFRGWGFIPPDNWLLHYNPMADMWEDTRLHVIAALDSTQLIVRDNRLFLVTWISHWIDVGWWFDICEIIFPPGAGAPHPYNLTLLRLPSAIAWALFNAGRPNSTVRSPKVKAFGSFKSIILMSRSTNGILIVYDLVKRFTELLPSEPTTAKFDSSEMYIATDMNVMNLVLPSDYPDGSDMLHNMNRC